MKISPGMETKERAVMWQPLAANVAPSQLSYSNHHVDLTIPAISSDG